MMRLQLALNVQNLDQAVEFYSSLFGVDPHKRKPGYANFIVEEPPLKLVLFESEEAGERLNHLGVEVFEAEEVTAATERLKSAGLEARVEDETTCCYARQDKVWAVEPEGLRWEWYRVLEDSETFAGDPGASRKPGVPSAAAESGCCS
jgi:catechol 2,3-dioxygenase-like lactoylglutathione lyase family enzyme